MNTSQIKAILPPVRGDSRTYRASNHSSSSSSFSFSAISTSPPTIKDFDFCASPSPMSEEPLSFIDVDIPQRYSSLVINQLIDFSQDYPSNTKRTTSQLAKNTSGRVDSLYFGWKK
jgi:hypothetical protein